MADRLKRTGFRHCPVGLRPQESWLKIWSTGLRNFRNRCRCVCVCACATLDVFNDMRLMMQVTITNPTGTHRSEAWDGPDWDYFLLETYLYCQRNTDTHTGKISDGGPKASFFGFGRVPLPKTPNILITKSLFGPSAWERSPSIG